MHRTAPLSLRTSMTTWALGLLAAIALLVAGGCGDGSLSKNDYIKKSNKIQADASAALGKINASSGKPEDIKKIVAEIDSAITETEKLKPPADWKKHHEKMIASMKDMRDALDEMSNAKAGDLKAATAAMDKITKANTDYEAAINAINADR